MNRRKILGMIGAAPVAAAAGPQVLSNMGAAQSAAATNMRYAQLGFGGYPDADKVMGYSDPMKAVRAAYKAGVISLEEVETMLGLFGFRPSANDMHHIDLDLQAYRSFSAAAKVRISADRRKARRVEDWLQEGDEGETFHSRLMKKIAGFSA